MSLMKILFWKLEKNVLISNFLGGKIKYYHQCASPVLSNV